MTDRTPAPASRGPSIPIAPEGWPIIAAFAAVTGLAAWAWLPLMIPGLGLTAWCVWFFRDPERALPIGDGLLVSPADGVVSMLAEAAPPPALAMGSAPRRRVSIFMNVFDVHVNRAPAAARVLATAYLPGRFLHAASHKASIENEQMALRLRLADGADLAVVQIAGLIARRIVCRVAEGARLEAGGRFGLIRFGSRVDVYLPDDATPAVALGQRLRAGESVIARRHTAPPSEGDPA